MLFGQVQHSLDDKGRIVLPAVYRELLHGPLYFALGESNEIGLWPEEAFLTKAAEKKERERTGGPEGAREHRYFTMHSAPAKMDAQFRIAIPEILRSRAELVRERPLTIIGAGDRLEIWDEQRLNAYMGFVA
jgi:MraZ protein